jgi:hypothetical protein
MDEKRFLMYILLILLVFIVTDVGAIQKFFKNQQNSNNDSLLDNADNFAKPYIETFSLNDETIRKDAALIVRDCPSNDKSCYISKIYYHIINNYNYISDPASSEKIQDYFYTKSIKGGECEDLTILMGSLLENIGVKTYFVLTYGHGYLLACADKLDSNLVDSELISKSNKVDLKPKDSYFIPFEYQIKDNNQLLLNYKINSNRMMSVLVFADKENYELYLNGSKYMYYAGCSFNRASSKEIKCKINDIYGIVIQNEFNGNAETFINIGLFKDLNKGINVYEINNQKCIVLDATAGKYGYPGFEANLGTTKVAFDLHNMNKYILN